MSSTPYPSTAQRGPSRARYERELAPDGGITETTAGVSSSGHVLAQQQEPMQPQPRVALPHSLSIADVVQRPPSQIEHIPPPTASTQGPSQNFPTSMKVTNPHLFKPRDARDGYIEDLKRSNEMLERANQQSEWDNEQLQLLLNKVNTEMDKMKQQQEETMRTLQRYEKQRQTSRTPKERDYREEYRRPHPSPPSPSPSPPPSRGGGGPSWRTPRRPQRQMSPQTSGIKVKAAQPDLFDGTTSKLEDWLRQVNIYFILQSAVIQDDETKILVALQYCRGGTAGEWARFTSEEFLKYKNGNQTYLQEYVPIDWENMKTMMRARFGDQYEKETARAKLSKARQGEKKVQQYIQEFFQWVPKAQLPEDQVVRYLLGGINQELWNMISHLALPNNSKDLILMLEQAERNYVTRELAVQQRKIQQFGSKSSSFGQNQNRSYFQNTRSENSHGKGGQNSQQQRPNQSAPQRQQYHAPPPQKTYAPVERSLPQGEPMDIDRLKRNQNQKSKIKCFKCRQFGHMAKNCTVRNIRELQQEQIAEILEEHFQQDPPVEEFDPTSPYGPDEGPSDVTIVHEEEEEPEEENENF